ncbi:MAG: metal-dependent hydrolase [Candidatus Gottesmanbacteria bacterium]
MRRSIARIKGLGYIFWHARHMVYHVLLGLVWASFLREAWGEFSWYRLFLALFGSLIPDIEHLIYFFANGRGDEYSKQVKEFLRAKEWRVLTSFVEQGHKYNTNLSYHNVYFVAFLLILMIVCFMANWEAWIVVLGAMVIHYLFDIFDDYRILGYLNSNWKRWGNGFKKKTKASRKR